MGSPSSASQIYNADNDNDHLQVPRLTSTLSTPTTYLQETGDKGRRRSAWLIKRALIFFQRKQQKKLPRPLIHNRLGRAPLFSVVRKITKSRDEESILGRVMGYVQGLQKQVKDIGADITLLQSSISKSDLKNSTSSGTVQTTFDTDGMNSDVRQVFGKELQGNGDDKEVIQKNVEPANTLPVIHVKNINEKTFHIQIYCKREAAVLLRLAKAVESIQLQMDFRSANISSEDNHFINNIFVETMEPMKTEMLKQVIEDAVSKMLN